MRIIYGVILFFFASFAVNAQLQVEAEIVEVLSARYRDVSGVVDVGIVNVVRGAGGYIAYAEVTVDRGFRGQVMATTLRQIATEEIPYSSFEFSVIINDGTLAEDYMYQNGQWRVTQLSTLPPSIITVTELTDAQVDNYESLIELVVSAIDEVELGAVRVLPDGAVNVMYYGDAVNTEDYSEQGLLLLQVIGSVAVEMPELNRFLAVGLNTSAVMIIQSDVRDMTAWVLGDISGEDFADLITIDTVMTQ